MDGVCQAVTEGRGATRGKLFDSSGRCVILVKDDCTCRYHLNKMVISRSVVVVIAFLPFRNIIGGHMPRDSEVYAPLDTTRQN